MGYDEFGARARVVFGNGVETRYAYDPQSRFLSRLRTAGAGRDLQNLRYQQDLTGTILAIQNDVPVPPPPLYGGPASQTFRYDDLYQLIAADGIYRGPPNKESTYSLSLAYDETGNVTAKNQLHQIASGGGKPNPEKKTSYNWAYTYGGAQPHAPTRIGDRTFRYDLNGNQTGWESTVNGTRRTLTWNEENRLAAVADNGQTTRFLYDSEGMRTNKAGPQGETLYVNRRFSLRNGAIASKHVFADDVRLATKVSPEPNPSSEKVYFYQTDHLDSTQFVTDELGAVYEHLEYFPSGETWVDERSETQRTPYLFSGKELDEETGLSYFGFRYYEARQGQWISADPILDGMLDVASLRRLSLSERPLRLPGHIYTYVANSPTSLVDPVGLMMKTSSNNGGQKLTVIRLRRSRFPVGPVKDNDANPDANEERAANALGAHGIASRHRTTASSRGISNQRTSDLWTREYSFVDVYTPTTTKVRSLVQSITDKQTQALTILVQADFTEEKQQKIVSKVFERSQIRKVIFQSSDDSLIQYGVQK
jgi:RHS repeat-associated protein